MLAPSLLLLGLAALGLADPKPPVSTYLYTVNLTIPTTRTVNIGTTPTGSRGILSITGGTFSGPKLNGTVSVGLDWGLTDAKGTFSPEAVYILHTADGANIMVTERGRAPGVLIQFDTGSAAYDWLNTAVAFATGSPYDGGVVLDVFQMTGAT